MVAASLSVAPVWAAEGQSELEKLELRFFHHTYPKDPNDTRIDRLEKMVYGEAKDGSDKDRIAALLKLVPDDEEPVAKKPSGGGNANAGRGGGDSSTASSGGASDKTAANDSGPDGSESDYPAVSAIEKKYFGKEFTHEKVEDRLARLEKKVLGRVSTSNDLSDRMDNLKNASGIDLARRPPPGADWQDEDDDIDYPAPDAPVARRVPGVTPKYGDDQTSFSGRNVAQDLNRAFGRTGGSTYGGGSGSYGMSGIGSGSSGGSGAYGFGSGSSGSFGVGGGRALSSGGAGYGGGPPKIGYAPRTSPPVASDMDDEDDDDMTAGMPPVAPRRSLSGMGDSAAGGLPGSAGAAIGAAAGGITGQLDGLEQQVFGKQFQGSLSARLDRLENVVFPNNKALKDMTPGQRIANLNRVIPNSTPMAQQQQDPNYDPNNPDPLNQQGVDPTKLAQKRGGFSKFLNSVGNLLGGGMMVGGYSTAGNLITDPTTGYLIDQTTGNMIDPHTGQVMGRRAGVGLPVTPMYGVNSFNNGFSPYGTPYGSPYGYGNPVYGNPMYGGIGGSGIRFGSGFGAGGMRFGGGMWP